MSDEKAQAPEAPMVRMTRGVDKIHTDYNYIDAMEGVDAQLAKIEMWIAKKIGTKLVETYPGRQWGVAVNAEGGIMTITNPYLSKEKGYVISLKGRNINELGERAVRAGGEILERYGITRGRAFNDDVIEDLPRNIRDDAISPDA